MLSPLKERLVVNVSIAGTLTYEDVTNIDSVGLVTARNGIEVGASPGVAASISVDGNAIFSGITTIGGNVKVGTGITLSPDGDVFFTGVPGDASGFMKFRLIWNITGTIKLDGSYRTGIFVATTVATGISGITTVLDLSNDDHKITVSGITTVMMEEQKIVIH